ncbi:MATE family efflux transporter [Saccharospirillum alexandrii]|uniref:MATE family efflux transporter n=1 Tax=Saccharospirillum alexandrii TaxID=2448477 RepID=UPI000FD98E75|nr:MATE family efflux transporter [Saccharospirillum alexandrii]
MTRTNHALTSAVLPTFYRLWIPSMLGLLALSTANIVDGLFIGNYVGATALAAVNLIIPFFGILFGLVFMLAMGGAVRAGKYIGEGDYAAASGIFSKTLMAVVALAATVTALALVFETTLLRGLGATDEVLPLMQTYFRITMGFVWAQLLTVTLYFFVRLDGYPALAAVALAIGSAINIGLDYLFIAYLNQGIAGAAWATGISQTIPLLVLCSYFLFRKRHLYFKWQQKGWQELFQSAFNGLSEFVNEVSGSIIALVLNWLFVLRYGIEGVAAFTVLNYLLVIGMMMVFSIGDAGGVFVSQNFGARSLERIRRFLLVSAANAMLIALIFVGLLVGFTEQLVTVFLQEDESSVIALAVELVSWIWPVFLVNGLTMIVTSYLTALHLPVASALIAMSRGLILPAVLLVSFFVLLPEQPFIVAIPLAEWLTFGLALFFLWRYFPNTTLFERTGQSDITRAT